MRPSQECASRRTCVRLNAIFGPPENPAWYWHLLRRHWTVLYADFSVLENDVPAWTRADLEDLVRRKKMDVEVRMLWSSGWAARVAGHRQEGWKKVTHTRSIEALARAALDAAKVEET